MRLFEITVYDNEPIFALWAGGGDGIDPSILVRRVLDEATTSNALVSALERAGFACVPVERVSKSGDLDLPASRVVRFPTDAEHEYAGLQTTAEFSAIDGLPYLVDPATKMILMPFDMPWRRRCTGGGRFGLIEENLVELDQVPLGRIEIPSEQFARSDERARFIEALREAGYEVAD